MDIPCKLGKPAMPKNTKYALSIGGSLVLSKEVLGKVGVSLPPEVAEQQYIILTLNRRWH